MSAMHDLRDYLIGRGLITLKESSTGVAPATPNVQVIFTDNGTGQPMQRQLGSVEPLFEFPNIDVEFRGEPNDFDGPMARALKANRAFAQIATTTINGIVYNFVTPLQPPYAFSVDQNKRPRIGFTVRCDKEPDLVVIP